MPTYLQVRLGLSTAEALYVPIIGMPCMMLFVPAAGALSDKLGRTPMWWASLGGLFLLVIPLYQLIAAGLWGAIVGFAVLCLPYLPQLATMSSTTPAIVPTPVRFAGLAFPLTVFASPLSSTS